MTGILHTYIDENATPVKAKLKTSNIIRTKQNNDDALFDIKVNNVTEGMIPYFVKTLKGLPYENSLMIANFVMSLNTEINPSTNYRTTIIDTLCKLSKFHTDVNERSFQNFNRQDLVNFLDSYRKPEASDPFHKWIGTYNLYRILLVKFFKWLYYPDIEPKKRPKPAVVDNIPQLKRKEKSSYKPSDMWTAEDDLLFIKYCPSKRMKCYHAISGDLSARPSEILALKTKDVNWKREDDKQYAEVLVNGKTGTRHLLLLDSIPYLKDYMNSEHPQPSNPNSPLICGTYRSYGRHITKTTLLLIYDNYKKSVFPKLLENPTVLPEDKQKIRELLKKRWNPYVRRHSALTRKSRILGDNALKQHGGWSGNSQMYLRYIHYLGNESNESLLEAYGIINKDKTISSALRPRQCPNCQEGNKPDSKYCTTCGLVLSYDAYNETIGEKKQKDSELLEWKKKYLIDMKALMEQMNAMKEVQQETQKELTEFKRFRASMIR
jgi:integrase/recombinase XerD